MKVIHLVNGYSNEYDKWTREKRKIYSEKYKTTLSMDKMSTKNNNIANEIIFNNQTKGLNQTICLDNIHEILIEEFVVISKNNNNPRTKLLLHNFPNE